MNNNFVPTALSKFQDFQKQDSKNVEYWNKNDSPQRSPTPVVHGVLSANGGEPGGNPVQ